MSGIGPQFKEVKPLVGAFVLGTLCIGLALVFATARAQRWFERVTPLTLLLPEDGSFGLRRGSGVELLGSAVGSVDDVWIDDETDRMQARLLIRTEFRRFVRADSRFVIKRRTLGLTGDAYVEITRGSAAATDTDTFVAVPDSEPTQLLQGISGELLPTIRAARDVIENHGTLAQALSDPEGALLQSLQRIERLLATLERSDSVASRLLRDPTWGARVDGLLTAAEGTLASARESADAVTASVTALTEDVRGPIGRANTLLDAASDSIERLGSVADDVQRAVASAQALLERLVRASDILPELVTVVRNEARGLVGVVAQSRLALAEAQRLVLALQDHWLLRGSVPGLPATTRMAPSELGGGR